MSTPALYGLTVVIWGTTWFAIKSQLDALAPEFGVALRFFVAAVLVLAWCLASRRSLRLGVRNHAWLALQGMFGFSLAYLCVYHAERFIVSGLVAVGYAAAPLINLGLSRWFFGTSMPLRVAAGGALGLIGISLVFWPQIEPLLRGGSADPGVALGAVLTLAAVVFSCLANMITMRLQRQGTAGWPPIGVAMSYGAACSFLVGVLLQRPGNITWSSSFVVSLAYLSIVGSVLAFGAYFTLLARVGAARASYVGVMTPVVALVVSTWLEHFVWQVATFVGVGLALLGNVLALQPASTRPLVESARESR